MPCMESLHLRQPEPIFYFRTHGSELHHPEVHQELLPYHQSWSPVLRIDHIHGFLGQLVFRWDSIVSIVHRYRSCEALHGKILVQRSWEWISWMKVVFLEISRGCNVPC